MMMMMTTIMAPLKAPLSDCTPFMFTSRHRRARIQQWRSLLSLSLFALSLCACLGPLWACAAHGRGGALFTVAGDETGRARRAERENCPLCPAAGISWRAARCWTRRGLRVWPRAAAATFYRETRKMTSFYSETETEREKVPARWADLAARR